MVFGPPFPEMKLYLVDVVEEPLKKAQARFEGYAKKGVERKTIRPEQVEAILGNIVYTTDYSQLEKLRTGDRSGNGKPGAEKENPLTGRIDCQTRMRSSHPTPVAFWRIRSSAI